MSKSKTEKEPKEKKPKKAEKTEKAETKKAEAQKEKVVAPKEEKAKQTAKAEKTGKTAKPEKGDKKAETKAPSTKEPPKTAEKKPQPKKKETAKVEEEKVEEDKSSLFEGIKLFNQWDYSDLVVTDPGLKAYICLRPVITPHTGGRYEHQRFKKAEMPIVERLVNKLMRRRKGTGKKERMIKAVKIAFEIIHLKTGKNPIQVLIDAIQNAAPREEVTRITYGGMAQLQSVDVAPMRRVDIALTNIVEGTYKKAFNNILTAEEILAQELIDAAGNKSSSYAISKMLEIERIALSAR